MGRNVGLVAIAILLTAGWATVTADAQSPAQPQTVSVAITGTADERPAELPGTYRAGLEVEVAVSGNECLCQETTVAFNTKDTGPASEVAFSPSSFTVVWAEDTGPGDGTYTTRANATIEVPADAREDGSLVVSADVTHEPGMLQTNQIDPAKIPIELPEGSSAGSNSAAEPASTNSSGDGDGDGANGTPGPGVGLAAVVASLAALGVRRHS